MRYTVFDLAIFAESLPEKYFHSDVNRFIDNDNVFANGTVDIYVGVGRDNGWSSELSYIIDKFVSEHGSGDLSE